jgi:hypothetical protein
VALGLSVIDAESPHSLRTSGIFTGLWGVIAPLIALFIGGAVASRGAGVVTRAGGALHGLVMWGLTMVAGAWLVSNVVMTSVNAAGQAADRVAPGLAPQALQEAITPDEPDKPGEPDRSLDESMNEKAKDMGESAKSAALEAAEPTSKVFWGITGALALGLISAILGGLVGVSRRQRMWADEPPGPYVAPPDTTTTTTSVPTARVTRTDPDNPIL